MWERVTGGRAPGHKGPEVKQPAPVLPDRGAGKPEPPEPRSGVVHPRLDSAHSHGCESAAGTTGKGKVSQSLTGPDPHTFSGMWYVRVLKRHFLGLGSGDPGETPGPGSEVHGKG